MADDQTQTVDPSDQTNALLQQMLRQTLTGQSMQPTPEPPHSGDNRTWGSLLGQALVGGAGPGSTDAQNEQAGLRALQQVGLGMMSGSDYSYQRHSLGSIIANAVGGAQESNAAQIAAQQGYAQKAQEMQLARVKEAVPLLTLLQTQQQLANARQTALGTTPTSIGAAHTGGIGAVGNPPVIARDPNAAGTAGQQANNSGNLMVPPGGSLPPGATGVIPLSGGRQVAAFPDVATGIAAQSDNLAAYQATHGINTVRGAVTRWVGDPKADLTSYIGDIAKMAGVDPDAPVDLTDPKIQRAFFMAQQPHESGKPWLNAADVDKGIALAQARRKGGQPPGAPVVAGAPQTPPPASTAVPNLPPGAVVGDAKQPQLAPGPPGSTGGAPIGIGAALAPPVVAGTPLPAGKLQSTGKPPGQAAADIIQSGVELAQATPLVRGTGQEAGPSSAVATLATPATPQPGWGSAVGAYGDGAATTTPPAVPTPQVASQAQPPPQAPAGPPRVPDQPPPYVRGPLPADIQAQIDHPTVDPSLTTALQTAAAGGDIKAMADARAAIGAAADKARAEAVTRAEAYHTAQQNIATEAWKVRRGEQAANDTALQKQAFDERNAVITSANTRLNAEAAKQLERNDTVAKTYGASRDAGMNIVSNIDQVMPALKNLPDKAAPLLQNEQTRSSLASMFGWADPELSKHIDAADLFEQGMNRIATQLSPLAPVGTEKASMVSQYRSLLPTLAQSPEGRELGLQYARDLARNGIDSMNWITEHKEDPAYFNKRLGVPDFDRALIGLQRDGPKMPKMPPIPSTFDPSKFTPEDRAASARYMAAIKPGQPYYAWQPGADGHLHATRYDWQPGADGKLHAAPGEGGG